MKKTKVSNHDTIKIESALIIVSSDKPWYHRLYQLLVNPFRWVFLGKIKYQ